VTAWDYINAHPVGGPAGLAIVVMIATAVVIRCAELLGGRK
jgi:hypothetical protein